MSYLVENPKSKFSRDEARVQKGNVLLVNLVIHIVEMYLRLRACLKDRLLNSIWFMDKAMISTTVVFVLKVLREQNAQFHKSKCDNMF